ncbi:phage tail family protein [Solibacillus isronensis]|uniref:phage tail family protein n=1 Tax=Solibacillus isronensis TaxID=412383 RepID=UPI0039A20077
MIANQIKITNDNGDSIEFGRHFRLIEGFDLSNLSANISYSESTNDGTNYQRTVLEPRDFDLSFFIHKDISEPWWIEEKRRELYRVCNPKHNPMRIDFTTKGGSSYFINANLANIPSLPQGFENSNNSWQKGLLQFSCNDPYIYQADEKLVDVATWVGAFSFPLELSADGIEMGHRSQNLIANVINDGDSDSGMIIRFTALANVVNPKLVNIETLEELKLNFEMLSQDIVEVSTYEGKKSVTYIRSNVRRNIFNRIDLNSKFFQLSPGDNLFKYDADFGIDNLEVVMLFTNRYVGV